MSLYILQFSSYMKFTPFLIWVCGTEFWRSQIPAPATKVRDTRFPWRSQRDSNKLGRIRYQSQVTNSHILFTPCFVCKSICHEITLPWDMRGLYQTQSRKIIKLNQTTFFKPNFWRFNGPMNDKVASIGHLVVGSYGNFLAKSDLLLLFF
jgi:hypothetical protein